MMTIQINAFEPPVTVKVKDASEIAQVEEWLKQVLPSQPPPEKIGDVMPWCNITVFEGSEGSEHSRTILIYSTRDRTTGFQLLSEKQRETLLEILHL